MDHQRKEANLLSELSFTEFLGKVFALEQGEANASFTDLFKIMKRIDAREKKFGRPAHHEKDLRKLMTSRKERAHMKKMIERILSLKDLRLVSEIPSQEFECRKHEDEKCIGFGNDILTDGTVEVLDHKYEPHSYKDGTDTTYQKIRVSGANWLIEKEWFHCGSKTRRKITMKESWIKSVDPLSFEFLNFIHQLGWTEAVRYAGFEEILRVSGSWIITGQHCLPAYSRGKVVLRLFFRDGSDRTINLDVRPKYVGDQPMLKDSGWDPKPECIRLETIKAAFWVFELKA